MSRSRYKGFSEGGTHEEMLCPQDRVAGFEVSWVDKGFCVWQTGVKDKSLGGLMSLMDSEVD